MKALIKVLGIFIFLFFLNGLFISYFNLNILPQKIDYTHPTPYYDYSGVLNVHSNKSTGSKSPEYIIKAAKKSHLDFLIFTDLNIFQKSESIQGYREDLLIIEGAEYSFLDQSILLYEAPNLNSPISPGQVQAYLSDLLSSDKSENQFSILAHPFKKGFHIPTPLPKGLNAIEIINLKSLWQDAWVYSKASFFWSLLISPFNPELAYLRLFTLPEKEIHLWDKNLLSQPIIGIAGTDAEAKVNFFKNEAVELPRYETLFSLTKNHVLLESELTGDFQSDRKKLLNALRNGNFYFSLDKLANPKGFNFTLQNTSTGKTYLMGSAVPFQPSEHLIIQLPAKPNCPFEVVLYRNGEIILTSNSLKITYPIKKEGNYRILVRAIPTLPLPDGKRWIPWIFSNNFHIY